MNWFRDVQRWLRLHASWRTGQSSKQPSSVSSTNLKCYQFREGSLKGRSISLRRSKATSAAGKNNTATSGALSTPVCTAGASGMWPLDPAGGDARTAVRQVLSFIR